MFNLIGFVGFASSGKDTVANWLIRSHDYTAVAFADSIKDCLSSIFCWDRDLMEGTTPRSREWRETVDQWWADKLNIPEFSPRWAMTHFGTDLMRNQFNENIWILNTQRRLASRIAQRTVVKDCRFPNEIQAIRDQGGVICRVRRGADAPWYSLAEMANKGCDISRATMRMIGVHESEWAWIGTHCDYLIENDGSIADLQLKVRDVFIG